MAKLYKVGYPPEDFPAPANGRDYQLAELKAAIGGGYIEIIHLGSSGEIMVIDEEGKLKRMLANSAATERARDYIRRNDCIVGDALVCRSSEVD